MTDRNPLFEFLAIICFLLLWLSPVLICLLVSYSGYKFSSSGIKWQLINIEIVFLSLVYAFLSGVISFYIVLFYFSRLKYLNFKLSKLNSSQLFLLLFIAGISAYGVLYSFGGSIFEKTYTGPGYPYLNYGAWSVTFLIALSILYGSYINNKPINISLVIFSTVIFTPFLFSGSRIDFFSFMIALSVYAIFLEKSKTKGLIKSGFIIAWTILIMLPIGPLRYVASVLDFSELIGTKVKLIPILISDDTIYLSTIGDIGASVFQVIGLLNTGFSEIGLYKAVTTYSLRLLPGPLFHERPGDFAGLLPEPIGGGALHSVGEGYLIGGLYGCLFVGCIMGIIVAFAVLAARRMGSKTCAIATAIFMFPWLLVVRGGWYQFFSVLKSLEVLTIIIILVVAVGKIHDRVKNS